MPDIWTIIALIMAGIGIVIGWHGVKLAIRERNERLLEKIAWDNRFSMEVQMSLLEP